MTEHSLDRILAVSSKVAERLMSTDGTAPSRIICDCLGFIGESVDGDYAFLWKHMEQTDRSLFSRYDYYWRDPTLDTPFAPRPFVLECKKPSPVWKQSLERGEVLISAAEDLHPDLRKAAHSRSLAQVILAPIIIGGNLWGCIGIGNYTLGDLPTAAMGKSVQSCGLLLASAIIHEESVQELIVAKEEALASTRAKTSFLSRMSHEIRTPINAITGMTLIARKTDDISKMRQCLEKIESASHQLLNVINDILDMSKIESDQFRLSSYEFSLEEMLQRVLNIIQVKSSEKRQNLLLDCREVFTHKIVSDELRLSQVLINLLGNAVKFTPEHGEIALRITRLGPSDEKKPSVLRFTVEDNGIGISAEQQKRLFRAFEQVDNSDTRKYGGSGLGLSICKKIVELMGGIIRIESEVGVGSRFVFEIPVRWGSRINLAEKGGRPSTDLRILVVDDEPDVLAYFQSVLAGFGMQCDVAPDGVQAIRMARERVEEGHPYQIVLLDWYLQDGAGTDTAAALRGTLGTDCIVIISSHSWDEIRDQAEPLEISHFLAKPVLPSTLFNTIVRLTEQPHAFANTQQETDAPQYHWPGKRLLLVEDIEINQEIVAALLEETGIAIDMASNGQEAVELFQKQGESYDLILMDIQMPHMDGLTATRHIRASNLPNAAHIPIFAMTANAFREDVERCLHAGMTGHLAKPLDVVELLHTLHQYLG